MRVKILSPRVTYGKVGEIVEAPDWVNVEAHLVSGLVEAVPVKKAKDED